MFRKIQYIRKQLDFARSGGEEYSQGGGNSALFEVKNLTFQKEKMVKNAECILD
jgi:hypothetical protein